ncbi:MAG: beta-lactamase family protein [Lentisphaeria bacterium]|nr:beta-lactamase family protein [Lentisphaeria bacterium]
MIGKLQKVLDFHVRNGSECGCQLVIYKDGSLFCDLCSGFLDRSRKVKVTPQTLFPVFSAGKSVLTTLCHILVKEKLLSYDDPVCKYWKEYGENGKEKTLVRDILSHRAALWEFPSDLPYEDYYNWEKACTVLEKAPLKGELGGFHEYHAYTYGILLGRLLEKAAKKELRTLLQEKILSPLSLEDGFFWGIPGKDWKIGKEIAKILPYQDETGKDVSSEWLKINNEKLLLDALNPSTNTLCNAHALAKIHASLLEKGVDGIKLLTSHDLEEPLKIQRHPRYPVKKDDWDKFGLGYVLCGPEEPWNRMFGQAGACGSEGFADRESGYAVGLTRNQLLASDPDYPLRNDLSRILGIPERVW